MFKFHRQETFNEQMEREGRATDALFKERKLLLKETFVTVPTHDRVWVPEIWSKEIVATMESNLVMGALLERKYKDV